MRKFLLGTTDFGIDIAQSSFGILENGGRSFLDIHVHGDERVYSLLRQTMGNDGMYGSWSAPEFYLRWYRLNDFAVVSESGEASYHLKVSSPNSGSFDRTYEIAVYWEEHHFVENAAIQVALDRRILVAGIVDLMGVLMPFRVEWDKVAEVEGSQI